LSIVDKYWRKHLIPGISVAATYRGKTIINLACGYRDGPARVRPRNSEWTLVNPRTAFRLASISKSVTAVAAMRMVERGEIDLDGSVKNYLPDFWWKKGRMTIRQLLSHTAGIRHYGGRKNKKNMLISVLHRAVMLCHC